MSDPIVVRLKPYNPNEGHVSRMKSISRKKYFEGQWVELPDTPTNRAHVEYLKTVTQEVTGGPLAFDVTDLAGAADIKRREKMAALAQPERVGVQRPSPPAAVDGGAVSKLNQPDPEHVYDLPLSPSTPEDDPDEAETEATPPPTMPAKRAAPKKRAAKKKAAPKKKAAKKASFKKPRAR